MTVSSYPFWVADRPAPNTLCAISLAKEFLFFGIRGERIWSSYCRNTDIPSGLRDGVRGRAHQPRGWLAMQLATFCVAFLQFYGSYAAWEGCIRKTFWFLWPSAGTCKQKSCQVCLAGDPDFLLLGVMGKTGHGIRWQSRAWSLSLPVLEQRFWALSMHEGASVHPWRCSRGRAIVRGRQARENLAPWLFNSWLWVQEIFPNHRNSRRLFLFCGASFLKNRVQCCCEIIFFPKQWPPLWAEALRLGLLRVIKTRKPHTASVPQITGEAQMSGPSWRTFKQFNKVTQPFSKRA